MNRYRLSAPVVVAGLALLFGGCSTIENGTGPDGKSRTMYVVNNNPADHRSSEGITERTDAKADAEMAAICAKAGLGAPLVRRKIWTNVNTVSVTYQCQPAP